MKSFTIGIDMDGVIADWLSAALKNIKDTLGVELNPLDITDTKVAEFVYKRLTRDMQKLFTPPKKLYNYICPQEFFYNLEPYSGAIEAIRKVAEIHDVVFITKPIEWNYCPNEKKRWLEKYFSNINYGLIMVDQPEDKSLVSVDIIVDDDPRVIKNLNYAIPVIVKQPYNIEFCELEAHETISSIIELPQKIEEISKKLYIEDAI